MDETLVFRKTGAGAAQLASTHGELSPPARRLLIMLDGRRSLGELAELFGVETVEREIGHLEARGFARQVDPDRPLDAPTTILALPATSAAPAEDAARRTPSFGLLLFAVVAAVCASAYWLGGNGARATSALPGVAAPALPADPAAGAAAGAPARSAATSTLSPAQEPRPVETAPAASTGSAAPAPSAAAAALARLAAEATAAPGHLLPAALRKPEAAAAPSKAAPPKPSNGPAAAPAETKDAPRDARAAAPPPAAAVQIPDVVPASASAPSAVVVPVALPPPPNAPEPSPVPVAAKASAPAAADAPVQVAALQPAVVPPAPVQLHPRRHEPPQFPTRALREGITEGRVQAMIWISPEGTVEQVDILHADPPRIFDDEVRRALSLWTFDPPGQTLKKRIDLDFRP